jgi:predicted nucleotidyltransferase
MIESTITAELEKLEKEYEINILYACESGSRAWGFPSPDSDYDVRFIYSQPLRRYLSIHDKKDTIDLFLTKDLDFIGWDIRKSLRLFQKSNASLFEWMQSPVVYMQKTGFIEEIRKLAPDYFSPKSGLHHYLGIAKSTYLGYLQGSEVKLKKYFYALRPLLCAKWVIEKRSYPPILFNDLLPLMAGNQDFMHHTQDLLARKVKADESELVKPINFLQNFIADEIKLLEAQVDTLKIQGDIEPLNDLFRKVVI